MSKMQNTFTWSNGKLNKNDLLKLKQFLEKINREFEALKLEIPNFAKKNETNTFIMPQVLANDTTNLNHQLLIGNNRLVMSYRQNNTSPWTNTQFIGFYGNNVRIQSGYLPQDPTDLTNKEFVEGLVRPFQQQIQQLANQVQQMQQQVTQALQAAQTAEQKATNAENLVNQLQADLVNYARLDRENIFTNRNRFNSDIEANSRFVSNGIATFNDIVSIYQRLNIFKNIMFFFNNATMGLIDPLNANELKIYTTNNGSKVWVNNGQFSK